MVVAVVLALVSLLVFFVNFLVIVFLGISIVFFVMEMELFWKML